MVYGTWTFQPARAAAPAKSKKLPPWLKTMDDQWRRDLIKKWGKDQMPRIEKQLASLIAAALAQ
jgi:hypothetical protein